jgi:hypothetical protein
MTRKDYMEGRITHNKYYSTIAKEAGISFKTSSMLPEIKRALASGDEHLNTIKLVLWDMMAVHNQGVIDRILKNHDDFYSLGTGVCVMKAAALEAAMNA